MFVITDLLVKIEEPKLELQAPTKEPEGPKLFEDQLTTIIEKLPLEEEVVKPEEAPKEEAPKEEVPREEAPKVEEPQKVADEKSEAPKFVEDMVDMEIIKGHPARFDVQVSGIPMPTLTWYRDGVELQPDDHFDMEFSDEEGVGSLIIKEVTTDDDAEYTCKAHNTIGETVSKADIFLQPLRKKAEQKQAPVFLEELTPFTCHEGDSVNYVCKVFGVPEPDIIWYRDNVELKLGDRLSLDYDEEGVCTLLIRDVAMEDVADYTCKATNDVGEATTAASLVVQGKSAALVLIPYLQTIPYCFAFTVDSD